MISTRKLPPFIEVTCEPDDEYQYLKCESSVAGLFFVRVKDGKANIFTVQNGEGVWSENTYNISDMRPTDTCDISVVEEYTVRLLPNKEMHEASKYN